MKPRIPALILLIVVLAVAASAVQSITAAARTTSAAQDKPADVNGAWAIQLEIPGGGTATPTVTFKQEGENLTGVYSSQVLGEQQVTGTVKGNAITFSFQATMEGQALKVTYTGTVDKDSMKGTANLGDLGQATFTAKKK